MVISEPVNIRWEVPNPEEEFKPIVPMDGKRYELDIILKAQFTRPEVRTEKNGEKSYWLIFEGISEFNANWRIKAEKTIEFYVIGKDQKTNSEREFVVLNLTSEERGLRLSQGEIPILIPLFTEGIFLKEPRK